jgi:beta-N-acetylhexosaminidase
MSEMLAVAAAVPAMSPEGQARLARAMEISRTDEPDIDFAEAVAKRDALLALA